MLQISAVLRAHPPSLWPSRRVPRHVVAFHGLQLASTVDAPREEIEQLARASYNPKDMEWNTYVDATKCFILGDRAGFEKAMTAPPSGINGEVLHRLSSHYGKPYWVAYHGQK